MTTAGAGPTRTRIMRSTKLNTGAFEPFDTINNLCPESPRTRPTGRYGGEPSAHPSNGRSQPQELILPSARYCSSASLRLAEPPSKRVKLDDSTDGVTRVVRMSGNLKPGEPHSGRLNGREPTFKAVDKMLKLAKPTSGTPSPSQSKSFESTYSARSGDKSPSARTKSKLKCPGWLKILTSPQASFNYRGTHCPSSAASTQLHTTGRGDEQASRIPSSNELFASLDDSATVIDQHDSIRSRPIPCQRAKMPETPLARATRRPLSSPFKGSSSPDPLQTETSLSEAMRTLDDSTSELPANGMKLGPMSPSSLMPVELPRSTGRPGVSVQTSPRPNREWEYHIHLIVNKDLVREAESEPLDLFTDFRTYYRISDSSKEDFDPRDIRASTWSPTQCRLELKGKGKGPIHVIFVNEEDSSKFRSRIRQILSSFDGWKSCSDHDMQHLLSNEIKKRRLQYEVSARWIKPKPVKQRERMRADDHDATLQEQRKSPPPQRNVRLKHDVLPANDARSLRNARGQSRPDSINVDVTPFSKTGALGKVWSRPLVYPPNAAHRSAATVDWQDLERLDEDEFLNDNLIQFGLRWYLEHAEPAITEQVYCFNTYFYTSLTQGRSAKQGINYDAVRRWTYKLQKGDIFQYNYIIVPINQKFHWYAAIICNARNLQFSPTKAATPLDDESEAMSARDDVDLNLESSPRELGAAKDKMLSTDDRGFSPTKDRRLPTAAAWAKTLDHSASLDSAEQPDDLARTSAVLEPDVRSTRKQSSRRPEDPYIITLDSFGESHYDVAKNLRAYLQDEALDKKGASIDAQTPGVSGFGLPTQSNYSDCGLYLLAYIQKFLEDPECFVTKVVQRSMSPNTDWIDFPASRLRDEFRTIVLREGARQNSKTTSREQSTRPKRHLSRSTTPSLPQQSQTLPPSSLDSASRRLTSRDLTQGRTTRALLTLPSPPYRKMPAREETAVLDGIEQYAGSDHETAPCEVDLKSTLIKPILATHVSDSEQVEQRATEMLLNGSREWQSTRDRDGEILARPVTRGKR